MSEEEKRRFPRLDRKFVLSYRPYRLQDNLQPSWDSSQVKNISEGGALIVTSRAYVVGTVLELKIDTFLSSQPLKILGTVVDCKEMAKGLIYHTAISYKDLDELAKSELKKVLEVFFGEAET